MFGRHVNGGRKELQRRASSFLVLDVGDKRVLLVRLQIAKKQNCFGLLHVAVASKKHDSITLRLAVLGGQVLQRCLLIEMMRQAQPAEAAQVDLI